MKSLSNLLNEIVSALESFSSCEKVQIVETISFSESQYRLKIRATLRGALVLQVYCYLNGEYTDYSYQLLHAEEPLVRWDNKEHFRQISSYPHHFHDTEGQVRASTLKGDITHDLPIVLAFLAGREG